MKQIHFYVKKSGVPMIICCLSAYLSVFKMSSFYLDKFNEEDKVFSEVSDAKKAEEI